MGPERKAIKIFSFIIIIMSSFLFVYLLFDFVREANRRYAEFPNYSLFKDEHLFSPIGLSYFAFLFLAGVGLGMYNLKKWAKKLYLILISITGLGYILLSIIFRPINMAGVIVSTLILICSYYFLSQSKVSEQFN